MKFHCEEVPVACSMVSLARQLENDRYDYRPFQEFICYWVAFNNIYTKIADHEGRKPELKMKQNGTLDMESKAGMDIVKVIIPPEREKIFDVAYKWFSKDLKHKLITHESIRYFVYRKPKWDYSQIHVSSVKSNIVMEHGLHG